MKKLFSVILPIYGNEENLPITVPYIINHLHLFEKYDVEIIMVCDGSPDNSWEIMKEYQEKYPRLIRIANLSRNYGQNAAIQAGMDLAQGDAIGVISADLQDPFELFADMLEKWEAGSKVVIATRKDRDERDFNATCAKLFHHFIHSHINKDYPRGGFDFFLLDKEAKNEYLKINVLSHSGQLPILALGYKRSIIEYTRRKREYGKSGYNFKSKIAYIEDLFISWTTCPLKFIFWAGVIFTVLALICGIIDLIFCLSKIRNWPIIVDFLLIMMFFSGILLTSLSIVSAYIYKIYEITGKKHRYIIEEHIK